MPFLGAVIFWTFGLFYSMHIGGASAAVFWPIWAELVAHLDVIMLSLRTAHAADFGLLMLSSLRIASPAFSLS